MAGNKSITRSATGLSKVVGAVFNRRSAVAGLALCMPLLSGCNLRQVLGWDMYNQPKARVYRESDFFQDKQSERPLIAGTIPRKEVYVDRSSVGIDYEKAMYTGDAFPPDFPEKGQKLEGAALKAVLERGQTVFNVQCALCHGQTGKGDGMIVQRGFIRPPSFVVPTDLKELEAMKKDDPHRWERTEFLKSAPPRHVYNVISQGWGAMYSYGERVKPADRWAVAAYIKALQANPVEGKVDPIELPPGIQQYPPYPGGVTPQAK